MLIWKVAGICYCMDTINTLDLKGQAGIFKIIGHAKRRIAFTRTVAHFQRVKSTTMKCLTHQVEAVAVCAYCGRAVCADCAQPAASNQMTCSKNCAASLARNEQALLTLLQKHVQGARINAVFYLLCGALSAAGAVGAYYYLPSPFLIWFCAGCSGVFFASGIWPLWLGRKSKVEK